MRTALDLLELAAIYVSAFTVIVRGPLILSAIYAVAFAVIIGFPLGLAWLVKWGLS